MAIFVFYADQGHVRRADCRNTVVAAAADKATGRVAAEALVGEPGALAGFQAVELSDTVPPFVVEGHNPVGWRDQAIWPSMTRGGDRL